MLVGGTLGLGPTLFSADGKILYCPVGGTLHLYCVSSGKLLSSKSLHTDKITALIPCFDTHELLTASLDGSIIMWDIRKWNPTAMSKLGFPIHHIATHPNYPAQVFVVHDRPSRPEKTRTHHTSFGRVTLGESSMTRLMHVSIIPPNLALSDCGRYAFLSDKNCVFIHDIANGRSTQAYLPEQYIPTLLQYTPSGLITGDKSGRLLLWKSAIEHYPVIGQSLKSRASRYETEVDMAELAIFHWHYGPVSDVYYYGTGHSEHLISVGREGVIVIWDLKTREREFVPRFGSPLTNVMMSPDCQTFSVCSASGSIHIVKKNMFGALGYSVIHSLTTLRLPNASYPQAYPLIGHKLSENHTPMFLKESILIPDASPSSLQLFHLRQGCNKFILNVTEEPYQASGFGNQTYPAIVTSYDVSDARWIVATQATFCDSILTSKMEAFNVYVKFYSFGVTHDTPSLNTISICPASRGFVTFVNFLTSTTVVALFSTGWLRIYELTANQTMSSMSKVKRVKSLRNGR
ncbi:hypothetical protein GEMRC1_005709 [Eukaryota sp. GEM-RC1]